MNKYTVDEKELCRKAAFSHALCDKGITSYGIDEEFTRTTGCNVYRSCRSVSGYNWLISVFDDRVAVYELNYAGEVVRLNANYMYSDYEFNWKDCSAVTQEEYDKIANYEENEFIVDGEVSLSQATDWIAYMFGFEYDRIMVRITIDLYCRANSDNSYKMIECDTIHRYPYASSETNNYIRFDVISYHGAPTRHYEVVNGRLMPMEG